MSLNKTANIVGIVAGIASIAFGYLQWIYPWPFSELNQKYTFNMDDFLASPNVASAYFKTGDTLRLEKELILNWSGVKSCGKDSRVKREYQSAYNTWLTNTKSLVDSLEYLNSSFVPGKSSSEQEQEPWPDNSNSCTGNGSIDCWIEFVKK